MNTRSFEVFKRLSDSSCLIFKNPSGIPEIASRESRGPESQTTSQLTFENSRTSDSHS
jgi:hypothetical protein